MTDSSTDLWVESHASLDSHDKLRLLAHLLAQDFPQLRGFELTQAEGLVHRFWHWALYNALDGDLSHKTDLQIALAVDWRGEPARLVALLMESQFVDALPRRQIHDWPVYAGHLIRSRDRAARKYERNRTLFVHARITTAAKTRDGLFCRLCGRAVSSLDKKSPSGIDYALVDPTGGLTVDNVVVVCKGDARMLAGRALEDVGAVPLPPRGAPAPAALVAAAEPPALPPPSPVAVGESSANTACEPVAAAAAAAGSGSGLAEQRQQSADVGRLLADHLAPAPRTNGSSSRFDPAALSPCMQSVHAVLAQWPDFVPNMLGYAMIEREHPLKWPLVSLERAALGYLEFRPARAAKSVTINGFMSWLDRQQRIESEQQQHQSPARTEREPVGAHAAAGSARISHPRSTL